MTTHENLLSRWARLKRSANARRGPEPIGSGPPDDVVAGTEAAFPRRQHNEIVDEPFDPASLPPVETITVDTDIRGFLQSCVPAELTRTALRRAWASDPAIRDFIGIAENQWDFNDPDAIPGFGPLPEGHAVPGFLAKAIEAPGESSRTVPDGSSSAEPPPSAVADDEPIGLGQRVQPTSDDLPPANTDISPSAEQTSSANAATDSAHLPSRHRRHHGGALPC